MWWPLVDDAPRQLMPQLVRLPQTHCLPAASRSSAAAEACLCGRTPLLAGALQNGTNLLLDVGLVLLLGCGITGAGGAAAAGQWVGAGSLTALLVRTCPLCLKGHGACTPDGQHAIMAWLRRHSWRRGGTQSCPQRLLPGWSIVRRTCPSVPAGPHAPSETEAWT